MKTKNVLSISSLLLVGFLWSCEKEDTSASSHKSAVSDLTAKNSVALELLAEKAATASLVAVNLRTSANFEVLSETGVTDVFPSAITGNVGSSPITGAAILIACSEIVGTIYAVDAAGPQPCAVTSASMLTTAVGDMVTAYNDGAGRINPNFSELGAGNIGGKTLKAGLYKWTSPVIIPSNITISGKSTDIWIFQVAGTLSMSSGVNVTLSGGAKAKNIYWIVANSVTLNTTSHFEGNILGKTGINLKTGASINGRMLAQTAVTLQKNTAKVPL